MDKSSATNPPQGSDSQPRSARTITKTIPTTPRPEVTTPSSSHATPLPQVPSSSQMISPQQIESLGNEPYYRLMEELMGRFSSLDEARDFFNRMSDKFDKGKAEYPPTPVGVPIEAATLPENQAATSASSPMNEPTEDEEAEAEEETSEGTEGEDEEVEEDKPEEREEAKEMETEESEEDKPEEKSMRRKKSVEKSSTEKEEAVVDMEGKESEGEKTTPDARAVRRSLRTARKQVTGETDDLIEEATSLVEREMCAEERKRKGKKIATPNKTRKPRQASLSVVIQKPVKDSVQLPQDDEELCGENIKRKKSEIPEEIASPILTGAGF